MSVKNNAQRTIAILNNAYSGDDDNPAPTSLVNEVVDAVVFANPNEWPQEPEDRSWQWTYLNDPPLPGELPENMTNAQRGKIFISYIRRVLLEQREAYRVEKAKREAEITERELIEQETQLPEVTDDTP